jgi:hypothetical protein
MTQQALLLQEIDGLPPKYLGEVIDFAGYLRQKAQREANESANEVAAKAAPESADEGATSPVDALVGILSGLGDITLEQIRDERLAKHLKHIK